MPTSVEAGAITASQWPVVLLIHWPVLATPVLLPAAMFSLAGEPV